MFHYGMMHALLVDWANGNPKRRLADALVETINVLDGGAVPVEQRLRDVELAAERAADSGIRTSWLTDEVAALHALTRYGLLSPEQSRRLRRAERDMHKSVEI
jgi:hypothetical protein